MSSDTNTQGIVDSPDAPLEFRILGPVEVARAGRLARLRGRGPRVVLCTLLFNRNRAVSIDLLIEALWGETAPPTARKTVQVYVSQMRKEMSALGGDADRQLETHGHGYLLRVEPGQLDADEFQSLAEQGRELHAAGDAEAAASRLGAALALWRGPVLADVAYEEAAREEIARLDELRVAAIEERIDADLDRGRHTELIAELQGLVGQHPTRERLRRQLMLALYRSGRQTEAVNAYADARRALSEQLGIDPGAELRDLERRILAHDPTLAPPASATAVAHQTVDGQRRWLVLAGAALLLAAVVAAVAVELTSGGSRPSIATLAGDSVGLIEPTSGRIVGQFPVGATPSQVVAMAHAMWAANTDQSIVTRIDLATGYVRRAGAPTPTGLALGAGALWVSSATPIGGSGSYAIRLLRLDPSTLRQQAPPIMLAARTRLSGGRMPILVTAGQVWAAAEPGKLVGVNPTTGRIRIVRIVDRRFGAVSLTGMAALDGAIWAMTDGRSMVRIDPQSGRVTRIGELSVISFGTMAAGAGSLWVTDPGYGRVWRVDPQPPYSRHDIITGLDASDIAYGDGAAWVTSAVSGTLTRIDPADENLRRFPVGNTPGAVTVSGAGVLVSAVGGSETAGAAGSAAPAGGAVAADSCGRVISGGSGRPQYLVVADLALDPADAIYTQRMAQAVEYELRAHHFSAGRYSLGLQVCDDSGTNGCTSNPKAYAATSTVIGVIGPVFSGCAGDEIPVLSRAGLAMIAPTPNAPFLTGPTAGFTLYPTGTRNFVRLSFGYDQEGVAAARLASRLGLHRVFVYLDDPKGFYASLMVQPFAHTARRLGIDVIGPDSPAGGFQRLARSLSARDVDGVFLAALGGDPRLIRALRAGLGPSATLIGADALLPLESATARVERGMYVLGEDVTDPVRQLPPAGRAFADAFGATRPAGTSDAWAPAAAQATDVLLTAIARSDGTRASVIHQLFRVRVREGILGSFAFTHRGDISPATVLGYRVIRGPALTRPVPVIRVPAATG